MNKSGGSLGMSFQGFYKVAIVDKDGTEVWRQPNWGNNLILNQGMNAVYSYLSNKLSLIGIAGIGTRANSISGGDSTGSAINGVVYLTPGATGLQNFSSSIVSEWSGSLWSGDSIKFADGTVVMATGSRPSTVVLGDISASIVSTATINSQSFTIYKTSATGLHKETRRAGSGIATSSYLGGGCGTTVSIASGSLTHLRTYDFGIESTPATYTEIGVGWSSVGWSSSSFARVLLPAPVSVTTDQRLRLIYQLQINFSPTASVFTANAPISGWPVLPATNTNITQSIQIFQNGNPGSLSKVLSSGLNDTATDAWTSLEVPAIGSDCNIWGSNVSQSLTAFGAAPINRWDVGSSPLYHASSRLSYVTGSNECYKYATFTLNELNESIISSFGFGSIWPNTSLLPNYQQCAFAMLFDQNQTKTNTQTLTMYFKWSWDRVLQ